MVTREDFAIRLCKALGAPAFLPERRALLVWMQAEGNAGRFNPLNTTLRMRGSTDFNSVGVQNYVSLEQGVEATAKTINDGADRAGDPLGYKPIRRRLRLVIPARWVLQAIGDSRWGTDGDLLLRVLPDVKRDYRALADKPIAQ